MMSWGANRNRAGLGRCRRRAGAGTGFNVVAGCAFNLDAHSVEFDKLIPVAGLYSATSRPFDKTTNGRIAVKVINHLGDEVMKVFGVS